MSTLEPQLQAVTIQPTTPSPAVTVELSNITNSSSTINTTSSSISRSSSQQHVVSTGVAAIDTDSGKSSCSPALLDCSFDSGIGVELNDLQLHKRIQQCQRILITLERDKDAYRKLRERLRKIVDRKSKKESDEYCNVCCAEIDLQDTKSYATCSNCQKIICRGAKCAEWLPRNAQWECQLCNSSKESLAHTSSWVAEQMSFNEQKFVYPMRARSEIYIPISDCNDSSMQFESVSQIGVNSTQINAEQKMKIREYVEELVARMLGGNLDIVSVTQMSKSENYLQLFYKYHSKLSNTLINMENMLYYRALKADLPAIANGHHSTNYQNHNGDIPASTHSLTNHNNNTRHINNNEFANISEARLRQLIESIIAETLRMSSFATTSGAVSEIALDTRNPNDSLSNGTVGRRRHRTEHYFEPKIYQDLLATAVLNKIVDKHGNTRPISESTPDLSAHHIIDANFNVENQSTTSGSSLEPRSDCSYTDTEPIPNVNKGEDISPCDSDQNLNVDNKTAAVLAAGRESALSDYIAGHMVPLPDLSAPPTESEEDGTSSTVGEGTWEDNWLFKKRRQSLKTSVAPGSIGMLVPAPKEDIRAQIGDKVADEVSDLSEIGSDTDDSSLDLLHSNMDPLNDRLLNKHLIGGQNTKIVLDELIDGASMISNTTPTENEPTYTETKNIHVVDTGIAKTEAINENVTPLQEVLNTGIISPPAIFKDLDAEKSKPLSDQLSSDSNHTNESTPTISETFTLNPEHLNGDVADDEDDEVTDCGNDISNISNSSRISNNATTNTTTNTTNNKLTNGYLTNAKIKLTINNEENVHNVTDNTLNGGGDDEDADDDDFILLRRFVPGSIAEREYKKWYNAVDMPNNPYAPDALKRRISGSQERFIDLPNISPTTEQNPINLIKDAEEEVSAAEQNREIDYKRYSRDYYINDMQQTTSPKRQSGGNISDEPATDNITINEAATTSKTVTEQPVEATDTSELEAVYQAIPAQVVEEHASIETQSDQSSQSLQSINTTTSDDSDTVRIYDFEKQETRVLRESSTDTNLLDTTKPSEAIPKKTLQRERPLDLQLSTSATSSMGSIGSVGSTTVAITPVNTPSRGSTPTAFKFLQPKRKLIEPSQVLSLEENEMQTPLAAGEKVAIEEEVAQVMPSVKALAQAFLLSASKTKTTQPENRWKSKLKSKPASMPQTPSPNDKLDASPTVTYFSEDLAIADAPTQTEIETKDTQITSATPARPTTPSTPDAATQEVATASGTTSPLPVGGGFLKSNIAFFENLKFK